MGLDNRLGDGQAEADARDRALGRRARPVEALEQPVLLRGRDADAGVLHLDERLAVVRRQPHADAPTLGGELHGVGYEVVEHLSQSVAVAGHGRQGLGGGGQRELLRLRPRARSLDRLRGQSREVDVADLQREASGLHMSDEQEVADEAQQAARIAVDDAEKAAVVGAQRVGVLEHELEVADDRGQRRAQLMRDQREELVLEDLRLALGRLAVDVLADLLAEVGHERDELVVARARLGGDELEHAKRGGAAAYRDADERVEAELLGDLGPNRRVVGREVLDPRNLRGLPHLPGDALAGGVDHLPADRVPALAVDLRPRPARIEPQPLGLVVDAPVHAELPVERLAEGPDQAGERLLGRRGLGEHARDGVLRLQVELAAAPRGDVAHEGVEDPAPVEVERRDRQLDRYLRAVAAERLDLDRAADDCALARAQEAREL